ncbi:MAG: outer membrane beta-barrel protein, partial [Ignavibacteria bacterium]
MKLPIIALIALFFSLSIFSQTEEIDDLNFSPVEDFYKLNYLNGKSDGKGNTGIASENDISAVYLNPAALELNNKFQLNIQYTYKTTQSITLPFYNSGITYDLKHIFPSAFIGFGYKINKKFQTGFIYNNTGSMRRVYTNGFETIDGQEVYNNFVIHSFGIPVTYKFNNFKFGVIADLKLYTVEYNGVSTINDPNGNYTITINLLSFYWRFGLKYDANKNLSIGATVTPGFSTEIHYNNDIFITPRFVNISKYPLKIGGGIEYRLMKNKLKFAADYNFEQLSKIQGYKDKHDVNLGVEYMANN